MAPDTKISDILKELEKLQITAEVQDGVLILRQGDTTMHTVLALRSLTNREEFKRFFVLSTADPKTWTLGEKQNFIREHGLDAWGKLCAAPVLEAGIRTLDPNMSKTDYLKLTTKERVTFIREFGSDAVSKVMAKTK